MLVTLAIGAMLAGGTVGARNIVQENRLRSELNLLMAHLNLVEARPSSADPPLPFARAGMARLAARPPGGREGWILFADDNGNHARNADEALLRVQEGLAGDLGVRFGETGGYHHLTHKRDGSGLPNATFTFCDARGASKARAIMVHWTGRPRVSTRKSDGDPLECP